MIIEINGCSTQNKGAELMLLAIQQHFRASEARVRIAVERWFGSYEDRVSYGLYHKVSATKMGRSALAIRLMPQSFRESYGLVSDGDVDAVLDASGFAFGDQHGPEPAEQMATLVRRWRRQGKKIVLLPQAFGPFTSSRITAAMRFIVDSADMVFARDAASHESLLATGGSSRNIRLAPDFTNMVTARLPDTFLTFARQPCVVPNARMVEKTCSTVAKQYIPFLARCVGLLRQRKLEPFLLLHDADADQALAQQLQGAVGTPLPVVCDPDPTVLKGILGQALLVIGSRYHALIGALSQAVPCLAAGWSHKYQMLLSDYGCLRFASSVESSDEELTQPLEELIDPIARQAHVSEIKRAATRQRENTLAMWAEVDGVLGIHGSCMPRSPTCRPRLDARRR